MGSSRAADTAQKRQRVRQRHLQARGTVTEGLQVIVPTSLTCGRGGVGSHHSSQADANRSKSQGRETYSSHDPHLSHGRLGVIFASWAAHYRLALDNDLLSQVVNTRLPGTAIITHLAIALTIELSQIKLCLFLVYLTVNLWLSLDDVVCHFCS